MKTGIGLVTAFDFFKLRELEILVDGQTPNLNLISTLHGSYRSPLNVT